MAELLKKGPRKAAPERDPAEVDAVTPPPVARQPVERGEVATMDRPAPAPAVTGPPRVEDVAANPLNVRDLATDPDLDELRMSILTQGQLEACTVVTRAAFLAMLDDAQVGEADVPAGEVQDARRRNAELRGYRDAIGAALYMQVTGGRRRHALLAAGVPTIDVIVKDQLAESLGRFAAATVTENVERRNLDPVAEARGVALVVREAGTGQAAAAVFGKSPMWVSHSLHLLKLVPEVQAAIIAKTVPLRVAREWHPIPPVEQGHVLAEWLAAHGAAAPVPAVGEKPAAKPRPPVDQTARTIRYVKRLGDTPGKVAESLRIALQPDDLRALIDLLTQAL
jgi:ParB family transcriptional regulator, chromosome partitioning protein